MAAARRPHRCPAAPLNRTAGLAPDARPQAGHGGAGGRGAGPLPGRLQLLAAPGARPPPPRLLFCCSMFSGPALVGAAHRCTLPASLAVHNAPCAPPSQVEEVLGFARVKPVVNQVRAPQPCAVVQGGVGWWPTRDGRSTGWERSEQCWVGLVGGGWPAALRARLQRGSVRCWHTSPAPMAARPPPLAPPGRRPRPQVELHPLLAQRKLVGVCLRKVRRPWEHVAR